MGGNLCGVSTGEALSRWCAAVIGNKRLSDFATAPQWAQDELPDFVNKTDPTDQNRTARMRHGIHILAASQGFTWTKSRNDSSLKDAGTLAQLYASSPRNRPSAFPAFLAAVKALKGGVTSDDPFGTGVQPGQITQVTPLTPHWPAKSSARSSPTSPPESRPTHRASVQKFLGPAPKSPNQHPKNAGNLGASRLQGSSAAPAPNFGTTRVPLQ